MSPLLVLRTASAHASFPLASGAKRIKPQPKDGFPGLDGWLPLGGQERSDVGAP